MTPASQSRLVKIILSFVIVGCIAFQFRRFLSGSKERAKWRESVSAPVERVQPVHPEQPQSVAWPIPSATTSDDELLRLARQYVAISPERAIAWARSATDAALRERLLFMTLRAWGEKDPQLAVNWALSQEPEWRFRWMEAALTGIAAQPAAALEIGRRLLATDAVTGTAYCTALVGTLVRGDQFQTAFELCTDAPADVRRQWLEMTLRHWSEQQPQEALKNWSALQPEELRTAVFQSLAAGWANNDPGALAHYAASMPAGVARSGALDQAFEHWLNSDPVAMGEWLNAQPQTAETDAAAAKLVMRTDLANRSTEIAIGWVEQIQDTSLKTSALEYVLKEWAQSDLDGARKYLADQSWLTPQKRQSLLEKISAPRNPDGSAVAAE